MSQAVIKACVPAAESNPLCVLKAGLLVSSDVITLIKSLDIQWLLDVSVVILSWIFSVVSYLGSGLSLQDWSFHFDKFIAVTDTGKKFKIPKYKALQGTKKYMWILYEQLHK